jgi:endonuclease IV
MPTERDLDFWKDVYRDALREIVRTQGLDGLMEAPRIANVCRSLADASEKALQASLDRCDTCGDSRYVFLPGASTGTPCPTCNPKPAARPDAPLQIGSGG